MSHKISTFSEEWIDFGNSSAEWYWNTLELVDELSFFLILLNEIHVFFSGFWIFNTDSPLEFFILRRWKWSSTVVRRNKLLSILLILPFSFHNLDARTPLTQSWLRFGLNYIPHFLFLFHCHIDSTVNVHFYHSEQNAKTALLQYGENTFVLIYN